MASLFILVALFGVMYFVMIRPQQKKMAAHRALMASLEEGDEVVTSAGIYGVITDFDGPTVFLEIADGVEVKVTKDSVANVVQYDEDTDDSDEVDHKGSID